MLKVDRSTADVYEQHSSMTETTRSNQVANKSPEDVSDSNERDEMHSATRDLYFVQD